MKALNHPNIVQLFDCIVTDDCMYLVMELVAGRGVFVFCLFDFLYEVLNFFVFKQLLTYCKQVGPLHEAKARLFFRDLVSAVDYLHRKGIVHHDLKLEHCLLDERLYLKLIDFGLATSCMGETLKSACESTVYSAPELFTAVKYQGPPVDVWAMGVIL